MRAISQQKHGYTIYAVSGTNTISFAIDFREADISGLLGFAVERLNKKTGQKKFLTGYKVFRETIPKPTVATVVSTYDHPVQSFVWDDFTCYDGNHYEYFFYPLKGQPNHIDRSLAPINIEIATEPLFSRQESDVFFNRGVASSQAYSRKFMNLRPDDIKDPVLKKNALAWLSRELDDAILKFIGQAKAGDILLGCFYEFHYEPVLAAFKAAIDRDVIVKLIVDCKNNETTDKEGKFHEAFPRVSNLKAMETAGISLLEADGVVFKREASKNSIQHNKFIVFIKNGSAKAAEVWTGSTNISNGGIHGQTNVGHWVRNRDVAEQYKAYWYLLKDDPGGKEGDDTTTVRKKNAALKKAVEGLQPNIVFSSWQDIPQGITTVFSPRSTSAMLDTYVKMFDTASSMSCITLAFGINKGFKDAVLDNTPANALTFMLLEKEDRQAKNSKTPFVYIGAKQNVYKAWGAYLEDGLYQWTKETTTKHMRLNSHVVYIHSKFLLVNILSDDPVVVTGSANFSKPSTNSNDENMLIIRGDTRVADIYFTEFNRIFNHYYFRAVLNNLKKKKVVESQSMFLDSTGQWLDKYALGTLRYKRVDVFSKMVV